MASEKEKENLFERFTPILLFMTIALAFVVGMLWQKVSSLEKGTSNTAGTNQVGDAPSIGNGKLDESNAQNLARVEGINGDIQGAADSTPVMGGDDHIRGSKDAKVFIIEYSDFECPFCSTFDETAKQALDAYGDDVAWIYRHYPLDAIHPNARPAANASECAAELGGEDAFWKFTDYVFANQGTVFTGEGLPAVADQIGIDRSAFENCIDSNKYADKIEDQYQTGVTAGVSGTPGNFIMTRDGQVWVIPGAVPFETLKVAIDEALNS